MIYFSRYLRHPREDPIVWLSVIVFLAVAFFLTIKSWLNSSLFLLCFYSCWCIFKSPKHYFIDRSRQFWMCLACLITPFVAELVAQMGRWDLQVSSLDGPGRTILAATVFIYLSRLDSLRLLSAFSYGCLAGIMAVLGSLLFFPDQYWGPRAATYFVDPITLPCYTVSLLGVFLFVGAPGVPGSLNNLFKIVSFLATAYIAVESQSRSSWVAIVILMGAYTLYLFRGSIKKQCGATLMLCLGVVLLYLCNEIVRSRIDLAVQGFLSFFVAGHHNMDVSVGEYGQNTGTGQRLTLMLIDFELITRYPLFGIRDGFLPAFDDLAAKYPLITKEVYEIKLLAGSHSELLAQLVRKGIVLGSLSLWSFLIYPIYLFSFKFSKFYLNDNFQLPALGLLIPIGVSSVFIQVFNLKMTISFYSLILAILFAGLCQKIEIQNR